MERRLNWCSWLSQKVQNDPSFLNNVLWSDETRFTNCGIFNRNNEHYWARNNPHQNIQRRNQVKFGFNVWAGIINDRVVGPFIFDENLTGERYLRFLTNQFQDYLDALPLAQLTGIWYQQDGAPAHNSTLVKNFLDNQFPNQWIGNRGVVLWPARSPDLTPMDYYLWGHLKNKIYREQITSPEDLRIKIMNAFTNLRQRCISRAVGNVKRRIRLCIERNGDVFEHML